ncbi:hypothetical protein EI982_14120 [Haloplanus rallus]|uniref:DUF8139 domain-containing protein n=1 Tax=Haloplanus rallus TaxID=1816183 RepID=A0A6B9F5R1_9EURY|nr:hypothetical protein [Haloplanus rallus]QGX95836.1 hypothetical protein EI982_14120 [Haloplanus rallus]
MDELNEGDPVRVDIPDETDPDHDRYHGLHGIVVEVLEDDADIVTSEERAGEIYRVELETGETADFRWRDLRPPLNDGGFLHTSK